MTSALSTSHLRALKKRSSSPSGLSCFTIPQNASLSSAGVWLASAALNSFVCPYLSSLVSTAAATSFAIFSVVAAGVAAASGLPLRDRKRPSFFFFSGDSTAAGAGVGGGDVVVVVVVDVADGVLAGEETPKTTRVAVHSSFSFASSSFVRLPGLPGNVFCGGGGMSCCSFGFGCGFMIFF